VGASISSWPCYFLAVFFTTTALVGAALIADFTADLRGDFFLVAMRVNVAQAGRNGKP
jgi:hypothetical protein